MAFTNIETNDLILIGRIIVDLDSPFERPAFSAFLESTDFNDSMPAAVLKTKIKKKSQYVCTGETGISWPTP